MDAGRPGGQELELRHLRALVAVVDEGSFTDAGLVLGVSQASVSRTIAGLEAAVGARVLNRTTREVALSAVGERIINHARRALAEAAAITRSVDTSDAEIHVGYAWAALGRHTTAAQRRWAVDHPGSELIFVQSNTPTAGLAEGMAEIAVLRRLPTDVRIQTAVVGVEARFAALSADDPLAAREHVALADFAGRTIGIDSLTGTTTQDLWPADAAPAATRTTRGVDEWLTLIAAGQAVGLTSEATARQHPRPGVAYRPVRDAQPLPVWLGWWRDSPPPFVEPLVRTVCELYGSSPQ